VGVVTVRVNAAAATQGGTQGVNEIVEVVATDEVGESRSVQIFVIDTILAAGPTGPLSTAAQEQPLFIAYHCDVVGRAPLADGTVQWAIDPDGDGSQGLDDTYDGYYTAITTASGRRRVRSNSLTGDLDLEDGVVRWEHGVANRRLRGLPDRHGHLLYWPVGLALWAAPCSSPRR
jgi:hypothetical protein